MRPVPVFDELRVISDLHLGGRAGFQIFDSTLALKRFIEFLAKPDPARPEKKLALCINGDFVDFLAESSGLSFDPEGALGRLTDIIKSFEPVWTAIRQFVAQPNRTLIINLGNHDVELALPWVRDRLVQEICGDNAAARARLILTLDGTGFRCQVGNARVLCVHGNEVDAWNDVNYEDLRRIVRDLNQSRATGEAAGKWVPNAGSQLVVQVMNSIKARYPFVDVLKPEHEAVVPTLLALDPDQWEHVRSIASVARRLSFDVFRKATGLLGDTEDAADQLEEDMEAIAAEASEGSRTLDSRLNQVFNPVFDTDSSYAQELLDLAEERFTRGDDPLTLISADRREQYLGRLSAIAGLIRGKPTSELLRRALEDLSKDRSFEFAQSDSTFRQLDRLVGPDVTFLIAGHTHLERALARTNGGGVYLNSGTWARLIKLEPQVLQSPAEFAKVFDALKAGTMAALDEMPKLVLHRLTVATVWSEGSGTRGELRRAGETEADGNESPVEKSNFVR